MESLEEKKALVTEAGKGIRKKSIAVRNYSLSIAGYINSSF